MSQSSINDGTLHPGQQPLFYQGGWVEKVNLQTLRSERLFDKVHDIPLKGPNDLVFDAHGGFLLY